MRDPLVTTTAPRIAATAVDWRPQARGATVWLTGLPSAGKTSIAQGLAERLREDGHRVELLDGDEVRQGLTSDLGFSKDDRDTNVRRIGFVAGLLARNGVKALVPVIAPYRAGRDAVRALHEGVGAPYIEVHVATPVETCAERDVKGLYAKHRAGQLRGLTGVDDPYEQPLSPDIRLDTRDRSLDETVDLVIETLAERGLV
jgi:adenylylsulfate kinase